MTSCTKQMFPTSCSINDIPFDKWIKLWDAVQLSQKLPAVNNPSSPSTPFTIYGLLTVSGTTVSTALQYLTQVTDWDLGMLTGLNIQIGTSLAGYRIPATIKRSDTATSSAHSQSQRQRSCTSNSSDFTDNRPGIDAERTESSI